MKPKQEGWLYDQAFAPGEFQDAEQSMDRIDRERRQPRPEDHVAAEVEWTQKNPAEPWATLRTQKKNRLAKEQMYHREYHSLCDAICRSK